MSSRLVFVLLFAFAFAACSSTTTPAKPDAALDAAADAAPDTAASCNSVTDVSTPVEQTRVAAVLPTAMGGTIPDGTYTLTHWYLYTGTGGATGGTGMHQSLTSVVTGSGTTSHTAGTNAQGAVQLQTYSLAVSGSALTLTQTCPHVANPISPLNEFTQSGNVVTLYSPSTHEGYEFTLMP